MYHTTRDDKPLEERVYNSDRPGGGFYLKKGNSNIPLPWMLPFWATPNKKPYMELATKLDNTLNKYFELFGEENLDFLGKTKTNGQEGFIYINAFNTNHYHFVTENYSVNFLNTRWVTEEAAPLVGIIDYNQDNEITINIEGALHQMIEPLLNTKLNLIQKEEDSNSFIDDTIDAIDELFIEQGLEPTANARQNLIGLVQNLPRHILETPEIQNLLGTNVEKHSINNPNLIRLAAKGVSDKMIKMFYVYATYPDSIEDMEDLANMPVETLYAVWGGGK